MSLHRTLAVTRRILAQFRHDRRTIALVFVAPIVILGLLDVLLGGGGDRPALAIVNADRGPLGAQLTSQLKASTTVDAFETDRATAGRRLADGNIAGYVVLPEDFSQRALKDGVVSPELHLEGSQPALSQAVVIAVTQAGARAAGAAAAGGIRFQPVITYLHGSAALGAADYLGAAFIGLVVFFLTFVITTVSFLRERTQGTLERLMASPLRRSELVLGYMLAFTLLALAQSVVVQLFALLVLRVYNVGSPALIFAIVALMAMAAVNLGIFLSTFARSEFQAVQFIPLVLVPQILLAGVIVPISFEPRWLQVVSNVMPLTYGVGALRAVMVEGADLTAGAVQLDVAVLAGFAVLMVAAAAATLRRRVA